MTKKLLTVEHGLTRLKDYIVSWRHDGVLSSLQGCILYSTIIQLLEKKPRLSRYDDDIQALVQ